MLKIVKYAVAISGAANASARFPEKFPVTPCNLQQNIV